jgi:protein-disulfide isomerase
MPTDTSERFNFDKSMTKESHWSLRFLLVLGVLLLVAFGWWVFSIPSTPNISGRVPTPKVSDPTRGASSAKITIVEFGDFQCEFCQEWATTYEQLAAKYGSSIRLVWKDSPLDSIHPKARSAAIAARCAQQQFKFWEYHDALFAKPDDLGTERYNAIAVDLGLNQNLFSACLTDQAAANLIDGNLAEAVQFGIRSTPTIFVGSYVLTEVPTFATMDALISSILSS